MMFRNETHATVVRASRDYASSVRASVESSNPASRSSRELVPISRESTPPRQDIHYALSESPEQLALNFFFTNFILTPKNLETPRGHFASLPQLYVGAKADSALSLAISAISFAVYGNHPSRRHLIPQARFKYGQALTRTKEDLHDPIAVKDDETLMTVLLFGLIEVKSKSHHYHCEKTKKGIGRN
jgi:hypothetical protein